MKNGKQFNGQMKRRQKDKQGSTKHYTQSKRLNNTPLKIFGELRFPGRVSRSCITCDTRRVTHQQHENHFMQKSCWTPVCIKTNEMPAFLEVVLIKCGYYKLIRLAGDIKFQILVLKHLIALPYMPPFYILSTTIQNKNI